MGKSVTKLPGLGTDLSRDSYLRLVLRRALHEALGAGMALSVVGCGSTPVENSRQPKVDSAVAVDDSRNVDAAVVGHDGGVLGRDAAADVGIDASLQVCESLEPLPCTGAQWLLPEKLHPNAPFNYLAPGAKSLNFAPAIGTPCRDALDEGACRATLDKAKGIGLPPWGLLVTRGDEVLVLNNEAALRLFLAPIDTPTEAALIGAAHDLTITCDAKKEGNDLGVQCLEDGFKLVFPAQECSSNTTQWVIRSAKVSSSGAYMREGGAGSTPGVCPMVGRAPDGLSLSRSGLSKQSGLAQFLIDTAAFEAASIPSFLMLAEDLRALGAPARLVDDSLAAAQDEIRHAQKIGTLAKNAGAASATAHVPFRARKSLWEVAQENAVEACIRETYGALLAHHQATCAADPEIAEAMANIAEDETRHAALGHRIALWAESLLSDHQCRLLKQLRTQAIAMLREDVQKQYEEEVYIKAGVPTPVVALSLIDSLERHLWN